MIPAVDPTVSDTRTDVVASPGPTDDVRHFYLS